MGYQESILQSLYDPGRVILYMTSKSALLFCSPLGPGHHTGEGFAKELLPLVPAEPSLGISHPSPCRLLSWGPRIPKRRSVVPAEPVQTADLQKPRANTTKPWWFVTQQRS